MSEDKNIDTSEITGPPSEIFQSGFEERAWLRNRGKALYINFEDKVLSQLRKYFNSLDNDGSGSIGVQQLEDPFIAFGLSDTRQEVEQLIKSVDLDGSGTIQFDQFLEIMIKIKRGGGSGSNSAMYDFFHRMSTGKLGEDFDKELSFKLNVSQFRRKKLLESMMSENKQKKQKGQKILQNFKKQILGNPQLQETLKKSKKQSFFIHGLDVRANKKFR